MDPIAMVTALADAGTAGFKEATQHEALNNSPEMQKALVYHRMQEALDQQRKDISDENLAAVRKLFAAPDAQPAGGNVSALIIAFCLWAALLTGCGTTAPKPEAAAQGSFDAIPDAKGNYQNSGVLGFVNHQALITPTGRARYDALVVKWGGKFIPPVKVDDGLTVTNIPWSGQVVELWLMDKDHQDKLATMNRWQLQPPPIKPP